MRKLLATALVLVCAAMFAAPVFAGSPTEAPIPVGDDSSFFGVPQGRALPPLCDGYGFVWNLQVAGRGQLAGTVQTNSCGTWNVNGTFDRVNLMLHAVNPAPGSGCADWFTYTGTHSGLTASGTWTNSAGGSGSWSMGRCN